MHKSTKQKSCKQMSNVQLQCLYSSERVTVYEVDIKEGNFIVLDYHSNGKSDVEVYWSRYTELLNKASSEYKAVYKIVQKHLVNG